MKVALALGLAAVLLTGCAGAPTVAGSAPPATGRASKPAEAGGAVTRAPDRAAKAGAVTKVLTFIEENHSLTQMKAGMPYLYSLAQQYAYADHYTALTHPSEPNYLAIGFGSTMGQISDHRRAQDLPGATVFGQAIRAGKTARVYQESMPSSCDLNAAPPYYPKHNPWAQAVDERSMCAADDVPMGSTSSGRLASDVVAGTLPNVGLAVPNLNNDAHDGSLGDADTWLRGWLATVLAGPDYRSGHLAIVVTADEDDRNSANTVLTTVLHPALNGAHRVVSTPLNHYSLSRLNAQATCTPPLRNAASAPDMAAAFTLPTPC